MSGQVTNTDATTAAQLICGCTSQGQLPVNPVVLPDVAVVQSPVLDHNVGCPEPPSACVHHCGWVWLLALCGNSTPLVIRLTSTITSDLLDIVAQQLPGVSLSTTLVVRYLAASTDFEHCMGNVEVPVHTQ
jgi:hypothetical protein